MDYRYFKITGGKIKEAFDRFRTMANLCLKNRQIIIKAFKADAAFGNEQGLTGLVFNDPSKIPLGWKLMRGESKVYRPHGSGEAMKTCRDQLGRLPAATLCDFQNEVFNDGQGHMLAFMDGLRIVWMCPQMAGKQLVLLVPKTPDGLKWKSPDKFCVEIKTSQYWKLKEKADK